MKGDDIPAHHHVVRHCTKRRLEWTNDRVCIGVLGIAFIPDNEGVSVSWLEYYNGGYSEQLDNVRTICSRTRSVRANDRLAVLKVSNITKISSSLSPTLRVRHDPVSEPPDLLNPAHSLIEGIHADDEMLRQQIAIECLALEAALT